MSLHPAFASYLDELNPLVEKAAREGFVPTPESARAALAGLNAYALPVAPVAHVEDRVLGEEGASVPVRVYVPRPDTPSDVVLFVHGGGHMAGDLDVYDHQARRTAVATGMVVVSVDYRLAPEHQFPAGLEDTHRVLTSLTGGLDGIATTGRIHAVADSGGGAVVASIAMRAAAGEWTSPIERQVLLYPSLDYTMSGESIERLGTGHFLSAERIAWYFDHYLPDGTDRSAVSPLSGPYSPDMPATLVIAAEYDPLYAEDVEYVERMRGAGAEAYGLVAPGLIHAFAFFETLVPDEIDRLYEVIGQYLRTGVAPEAW